MKKNVTVLTEIVAGQIIRAAVLVWTLHDMANAVIAAAAFARKASGLAVRMLIDRLTFFCDLYAPGMHCSGQLLEIDELAFWQTRR